MALKTITFTCETITPMFLSGADGQTPELRPPSIKGALRFWWRAMNGNLPEQENQHWDYKKLKEEESKLFGGSGGFKIGNRDIKALKSDFNIRITNQINDTPVTIQKTEFDNKKGLEYFFYLISSGMAKKVGNDKAFKKVKFDLTISSINEDSLLKACASFWLLTYFGGLGSRARRGGGSFTISKVVDNYKVLEGKLNMKPNEITELEQELKRVYLILSINDNIIISNKYSTLQKENVYISTNTKNNWKDILNEIAIEMLTIRTGKTHREKAKRTFKQDTLDQKAAFGLPLSIRNEDTLVEFDNNEDFNHRSSPIAISVIKLGEKYHWTLVHLQGEFMPPNANIVFNPSTRGLRKQKWINEDNVLIKRFIGIVKSKSTQLTFP